MAASTGPADILPTMKTLLRSLLYLALIVWLGAEVFFPVVAAVTFMTIPDTHMAGTVVARLIRILHDMGLVAGIVALILLALAPAWNIYKSKTVLAPMVLLVVMIACTAYSQWGIIPAMEHDRIAAGGAINTQDTGQSAGRRLQPPAQPQHWWKRRSCCWAWPRWCWWRMRSRLATLPRGVPVA